MATVKFKGNEIQTLGSLPAVGSQSPDFKVVGADLSEKSLSDFQGKTIILNIFPSIDTSVCATSVRAFNEAAASLPNIAVLCISMDLPFAMSRFCGAENIKNVITASDFRYSNIAQNYGVRMQNGPLAGLLARSVVVIDGSGKVKYTELVADISQEPNYPAALSATK
ncbi:MAG: thiol peroxidase [Leptonema sp. (in: Bacteria)]|nr:thiol peroxidase [Leptonema sp. (in: bacteria)]